MNARQRHQRIERTLRPAVSAALLCLLIACSPKAEHKHEGGCVDLMDNDEDGQVDCVDSDCTPTAECAGYRIGVRIDELQAEIVSVRSQRRDQLRKLYSEYGGGLFASRMKSEMDKNRKTETASEGEQMVEKLLEGPDFEAFKKRCAELGSGAEMVLLLDPKLIAFLGKPDTKKACTAIEASRRASANKTRELKELQDKRARLPAR